MDFRKLSAACLHYGYCDTSKEIEEILKKIDLAYCFDQVHGSPKKKEEAEQSLRSVSVNPNQALFVGDAETDFCAVIKSFVPFLWRETSLNRTYGADYRSWLC